MICIIQKGEIEKMGKFYGQLNVKESGKTTKISILKASFKEEKIIEVSLKKFNNDCPCAIERRNCELTIGNNLLDVFNTLNNNEAIKMAHEFMNYDEIELLYK